MRLEARICYLVDVEAPEHNCVHGLSWERRADRRLIVASERMTLAERAAGLRLCAFAVKMMGSLCVV